MPEALATRTARWVVIVELTALPAWLTLDRSARESIVERVVHPVLASAPEVDVHWIDVESFTASCSDVLLAQTPDLLSWNRLWERMRDTPMFTVPYFRVERILPGLVEGHRDVTR
ncbi:darcynin-like uncharacterized protein [Micromonospora sp. Llam0]|uniref:darcynin family protein n=1 Tax=Micromonospora sp. Llam0 TaxID=2485143 RepID=UPI000F478A5A|nr:darcynin family protein [Micromonospora sp. Llam0]ROO63156.1 darcynin-like uncharacterized protein [Micromonospora sp. Llam0]